MNSRSRNRTRTVKAPFHSVQSLSLGAGTGLVSISSAPFGNALSTTRIGILSDAFDEYRLTKLKYRLLGNASSVVAGGLFAMAWYPGVTTTPPSTPAQVGENPTCVVRPDNYTCFGTWLEVPPGDLAGEQPWYKVGQAVSLSDSVPGFVYGADATGAAAVYYAEFDGEYEFRGEAAPANTPEAKALRLQRDIATAKEKLVAILASPSKQTTK